MQHRPDEVGDAITVSADGRHVGHYLDFDLHSAFQPIVALAGGHSRMFGFEALVRPFRAGKPVTPAAFFSTTMPGDEFFIDWLCRALHLRNFSVLQRPGMRIFINLDPSGFRNPAVCRKELDLMFLRMDRLGIGPDRFVCEIVEKRAHDDAILLDVAHGLRAHGAALAIDDYGVRYSDFHRARLLKPDIIKIDANWTRRLRASPQSKALLGNVCARIRDLGIELLFEGVEDKADAAFAIEQSMDYMQGFMIARPAATPDLPRQLPGLSRSGSGARVAADCA